ncbi:MAG: transposase [Actinomycetota bacterium]|nr:transposase [Actinomycetota bacterium]
MCLYTITKLINITGHRVSEIISITPKEIHVRIEAEEGHKAICSECGEIHQEGYHSSKAITTNGEAGWYLGLDDEKVYRIDKAILEEQAKEKLSPPPAAANISVDEVSYRKYHRYLTNVIDVDKKLLIWNEKGRKAEVLDKYYESIGDDNCKKIESVALDGAKTYISSAKKNAINALIVLDRFHATQEVNQAVDRVRKDELAKARNNKDEEIVQLTNCGSALFY